MKRVLILILLAVAMLPGSSQDLTQYKKIVKDLSSARFQGRGYARGGANKAGKYLEKAYRKAGADGKSRPLFAFWTCGHTSGKWRDTTVTYDRPSDSFTTRPTVIDWNGPAFEEPVWVDLLTGRVYAFPKEDMLVHSAGVTFVNVPVYASPCVLTERAALKLQ